MTILHKSSKLHKLIMALPAWTTYLFSYESARVKNNYTDYSKLSLPHWLRRDYLTSKGQ